MNQQGLDQLAQQIVDGSYSALFPEEFLSIYPTVEDKAHRIFWYLSPARGKMPVVIPVGFIATVSIADPVSDPFSSTVGLSETLFQTDDKDLAVSRVPWKKPRTCGICHRILECIAIIELAY